MLGNDLAGDKVFADPIVVERPSANEDDSTTVEEELFPVCAVTRAMTRKKENQKLENVAQDEIVDLADTFMSASDPSPEVSDSQLETPRDRISEKSEKTKNNSESKLSLSRQKLIDRQQSDPEIISLLDRVVPEDELDNIPVAYYLRDGVLMRKWRPTDIPASEDWAVVHQIVVPENYRQEIMRLAHEIPMGGHLGINKTCDRIMRHFFWPGLRRSVSEFCRTCHSCQMVGKPSVTVPVAPLQPIPAFEEPFSRVIIDCVGPLPKTKSGNEYLLTVMCAATRFPEAIPLRNINARNISKALIKFFTLVGLPKEIQSDQGSNFMSGLFQQVVHQLGAKQIKSSAYHPESQGALERFHSTLKTMIKTYCHENEKDWDEGIPFLLFASREVVQESLGFSPFELVFGHTVRGPLKLVKETWMGDESQSLNLLDYVSKFKERLHRACELAQENLKFSQHKMKTWYDKNAKERQFKPGDKVLVLLPIRGNPLQAKFHGPYQVEKKVNELDYVVKTPDRRKSSQLCHINMIKPYYERGKPLVSDNIMCDVKV